MPASRIYDVIVVGAGDTALCAAISASENGANVLVLEKASINERGGNSLFTAGGFRFAHGGLADIRRDILVDLSAAEADRTVLPPFTVGIYTDDLMRVIEYQSYGLLGELLVGRSRDTMVWMQSHGVRFIPMLLRQSYLVNRKHHFYGGLSVETVGGGLGLVDALLKGAAAPEIEIRYEASARHLLQDRRDAITGVTVMGPDGYSEVKRKRGRARLRRVRGQSRDAQPLSRTGVGAMPGPRHPPQHRRRYPACTRDWCAVVRRLVYLSRRRPVHQRATAR